MDIRELARNVDILVQRYGKRRMKDEGLALFIASISGCDAMVH